jgi:hypothetical protein
MIILPVILMRRTSAMLAILPPLTDAGGQPTTFESSGRDMTLDVFAIRWKLSSNSAIHNKIGSLN